MRADELKRNLIKYKNYRSQKDIEAKKIEDIVLNKIVDFLGEYELKIKNKENKAWANVLDYKKYENQEVDDETSVFADISRLKKESENYNIPKLLLYILSEIHHNWVADNYDKLLETRISEPWKFVPFNLLRWRDLDNYIAISKPIFNALGINVNIPELKQEYDIQQLTFLLDNGIHCKDDLKMRIKNVKEFYVPVLPSKKMKYEEIKKVFSQEKIAEEIASSVSKRVELNTSMQFKNVLLENINEVGMMKVPNVEERKGYYAFENNQSQKKIGVKKYAYPIPNKPINKCIFDLAKKCGIIFAKNIKRYNYKYDDLSNNYTSMVRYIPYKDCLKEEKEQIEKRRKKLDKLVSKIQRNKSNKYDVPGIVTLIFVKKPKLIGMVVSNDVKKQMKKNRIETAPKIIQIEVTQRELAMMGVLPKELGWESKKKVLLSNYDSKVMLLSDSQGSTLKKDSSSIGIEFPIGKEYEKYRQENINDLKNKKIDKKIERDNKER